MGNMRNNGAMAWRKTKNFDTAAYYFTQSQRSQKKGQEVISNILFEMLFKILSFCFQRFREGCRKRQLFFQMSPLLINCVSEVLSYQRVYSGEVFKILLLLQIKPGKCTEMYLKFLSTDVKAE